MMILLSLIPVLLGMGQLGSAAPAPRAVHDFHVTYSQMAVEGKVAACRIRFFKDDLELALQTFSGQDELRLVASPRVDSLFVAYMDDRLTLEIDAQRLPAQVIGSGEDMLDREPVWWYTVQFEAPDEITAFSLTNTLLFEVFVDQKNIVKIVHFPDETQRAYYFAAGEERVAVSF